MIYKLTQNGIDAAVGAYEDFCQEQDVAKKEAMMLSMSMDSMLTKMSARYGEDFEFSFSTGKRFGRPFAKILWAADKYNPLEATASVENEFAEATQGQFFSAIYQSLEIAPHYTFRNNINTIQMPFSKKAMNPILFILLSIVAGMVFGILTQNVSENVLVVFNLVGNYISSLVFGLITMIAAPMIFLCIVNGIVGVGSVHEVGKIGRKTVTGFIGWTFVAIVLEMLICSLVFPVTFGSSGNTAQVADQLLGSIFGIFPVNIIIPFIDGNFAQIIGLAIVFGMALLVMGEKASNVIEFCGTLNYAITIAMSWCVKLVPFAIFIMFAQYIWDGSVGQLLDSWKAVVVFFVELIIMFIIQLLLTAYSIKIPCKDLFKMVSKSMLIGFSTGSSSAAFLEMRDVASKKLQLNNSVTDFSIPLGLSSFTTGLAAAFVALTMFVVSASGMEVNFTWIILMLLLSLIFSCAAPPVAGGGVACIAIIFDSMGLPSSYLAIATSLIILLDYFITLTKCGELVLIVARISKQMDDTIRNAKRFWKRA